MPHTPHAFPPFRGQRTQKFRPSAHYRPWRRRSEPQPAVSPKDGATVGTAPLPGGQTAENAQREKENGAEDAQTAEVVLQNADLPTEHKQNQEMRNLIIFMT